MPGTSNSGGRNAKSREALVLAGTFRADRHSEIHDPPRGKPDPPLPLEGESLAEWDRMVGRLEQSHMLSKVDDAAIYQYAKLFAETEHYVVQQEECGESVDRLEENLSGLEGKELVECFQEISKMRALEARYSVMIRQGRMAIRQYLVEFGMTPAARSRVKLPASQPKTKLEQFRDSKRA